MTINIALGVVAAGASFALWRIVSPKLRELKTIPDEVVASRLTKNAEAVHRAALRAEALFRGGRYKETLLKVLVGSLYRVHRMLLVVDRMTLGFLERVHARLVRMNAFIEKTERRMKERSEFRREPVRDIKEASSPRTSLPDGTPPSAQ